MKCTLSSHGRASALRRPQFPSLRLELLEQRLPPGDVLFGALLGPWWLGAFSFWNQTQRTSELAVAGSSSATESSKGLFAVGPLEHSLWKTIPDSLTAVQQPDADSQTRPAGPQWGASEPLRPRNSLPLDALNQMPMPSGQAAKLADAPTRVVTASGGPIMSETVGMMNRQALTPANETGAGPQGISGSGLISSLPTSAPAPANSTAVSQTATAATESSVSRAPTAEQSGPQTPAPSELSVASTHSSTMNEADSAPMSAESQASSISALAPSGPSTPAGPQDAMLLGGIDGLRNTCGCSPPDTIGAAGPSSFIESVNNAMGIYNKTTGAQLGRVELGTFFNAGLGGVLSLSDPIVVYDEMANQFLVGILDFNGFSQSRLDVAISNTPNPSVSASDWTFRRYNANDGVGGFDFADYPKIGYNADGYVVSLNMFIHGAGNSDHVTTLSIRKSDLTGYLNIVSGGRSHFTFAPTRMHDAATGSPMWFVEAPGSVDNVAGNQIRVVRMDNAFSAAPAFTYTDLTVDPYVAQPGPLGGRTGLGTRMYHAALRTVGGVTHLVAAHSPGFNDGSGTRSKVQWYDVDVTNPASPRLIQQGRIDPGRGVDTYFPDADIGRNGSIGLNYSQSVPFGSSLPRPGIMDMYVTGRAPGDPLGTMETPLLAKLGTAILNAFGRAGDYSFTTLDPVDGTFWAANEYSASVSSPNWATWIAHFQVEPPAGPSVISNTPSGNTFGDVSSLRLTFDEEIDPSTFTLDKIDTFTGPGGVAITATGVAPVAGSDNRQFDVSFPAQHTLGSYTMVIGPDIEDIDGHMMDQNHNGIPGEPGLPPDGDEYAANFTIQGPKITASTPSSNVLPAVDHVRVTFNEPMNPTTFTTAKVASFTRTVGTTMTDLRPGLTAVTPVAGSNNTQFDITFTSQAIPGMYAMVVGPDIQDLAGHQMDQNGNFIEGEVPGDQYTAQFGIVGPKIIASTPTGRLSVNQLPVRSVRVTFNERMNPATFTPNQVFAFRGPAGSIDVSAVTITAVAGSNDTQFDIAGFAPQGRTGVYHMLVGPNVRDLFGNAMDQDGDFITGEIPGDLYDANFSLEGARITASTPTGSLSPQAVSSVQVTFNEPMDPATFTTAKIASFTRTVGTTVTDLLSSLTNVTPIAGSNNTRFNIAFTSTGITGHYAMVIGPDIRDTFGNQMDQNNNLTPGEPGVAPDGDQYRAAFDLQGPRITASGPTGTFLAPVGGLGSVQVTFNEPMDPTTFTPAKIANFTRTVGTTVTDLRPTLIDVTAVAGSNNTRFNINFTATGTTGAYAMVIGPDIRDVFGNQMDQNNNLIPGEIPGDQYTHSFNLAGPRINFNNPSEGAPILGQVFSLRVGFNETMDPATFTPAKIASFTGPAGAIAVTGVFAVAGTNYTQFDITFAPQSQTGRYTMVIGPDIRDYFGNQMDQNGNLIPGEIPGDQYTARFGIQGPRILASTPNTNVFPAVDHVRVTFNEAMNASTFTVAKIASFSRTVGSAMTDLLPSLRAVTPVPFTGNTQFDIAFTAQGATGRYAMVIGPDIRDLFGNPMDQNGNLIPGEIPGDQYTANFGLLGPRITASTPSGDSLPVDHVRVTFNEPMNPDTFTPAKIASFAGPAGDIPVTNVTVVPATNNTQFDITFDNQSVVGSYTMVIGPDIRDVFGNQMDQNNNLIPGEIPGDQYTARFNVISTTIGPDAFGHVATAAPVENLEIVGQPGTFNILGPGWVLNQSVPVNLGNNTFTFYGRSYTGNNQLFVSSNALITLGSANAAFSNTDLTASPPQAAIAAAWFPWRRRRFSPILQEPLVVGQFADIDPAGVPHRLIIEWNKAESLNSGGNPNAKNATFQVVLSLNTGSDESDILLNYRNLQTGGRAAEGTDTTVGIKDSGTQGSNRLLVNFSGHSPFVGTGQAIRLTVAPTGLRVTNATASSVALAWNYRNSNVDGFSIERSTDGIHFTPNGTTDPDTRTFADSDVVTGGTYYYRVQAYSGTGTSPYSNVDSVKVGAGLLIDHSDGFAAPSDVTKNGSATFTPNTDAVGDFGGHQDFGNVARAGGAVFGDGTYTLMASGSDIWATADAFHYVYEPLVGDGEIVARTVRVDNTDFWAKAGVMIRDSLAANSKNAFVFATEHDGGPGFGPNDQTVFQLRAETGGFSSDPFSHGFQAAAPVWLRLVRSGNNFKGYWARDLGGGKHGDWSQLGPAAGVSINMPGTVLVGLALTAHNNSGVLNTSIFDNVTVTGDTALLPPTAARLTDGGFNQAGSIFSNNRVDVTNFATTFSFQLTPGTNPTADGFTFTIQGNNPAALGPAGGGLGYGPDRPDPTHMNKGIRNSVAVKFDLYSNAGEGVNSTGIFTDGRSPTVREPGLDDSFPDISLDLSGSGIDLHSQHVFSVTLTYDGTMLTETITDTATKAMFSHSYAVDIASLVGSNVAYVGFTGGTGDLTAIQDIQTWTYEVRSGGGAATASRGAAAAVLPSTIPALPLTDAWSSATASVGEGDLNAARVDQLFMGGPQEEESLGLVASKRTWVSGADDTWLAVLADQRAGKEAALFLALRE